MSYETGSLLVESQVPLDGILWQPYEESALSGFDASGALLPSAEILAAERERFFSSGRTYVPDLRPRAIDVAELDCKEQTLLGYKAAVQGVDAPEDLIEAYKWRVNEHIANLRMVRAAATGNNRRFTAYNAFIYGSPDPEIFGAVADTFCTAANTALRADNPAIQMAAGQVLEALGSHATDRSLIVPSAEIFQRVRDEHMRPGGYYALLLAGVELPESGSIRPDVGDAALRQVLRNLQSNYDIQDASGKLWSLSRQRGAVLRPAEYAMSLERFIGLPLGHEVGSHLLEHENGKRSAIRLLGDGLDRYEHGNEGRPVLREQIMYRTFEEFSKTLRWQDIMRRHLATSLAEGLAGQPMNIADAFKVVNAVDLLYELTTKPGEASAAVSRADNRTWKLLAESVYKGTDGNSGCYRRYKLYLEGNVGCWREAERNPDAIRGGDLGKFDITNPRHIALLQRYGILPKADKDTV